MGKNILWFFIVTFLSFSSGCVSCQYYDSYQPQAIDWNMHGEETKWKEPKMKGEKPSDAWERGGMFLVMLSPVFGFLAFVTSVLVEKQMQKSDKLNALKERLNSLTVEELEKELLKTRKDLAWINGGFYSEDSKAVVEAKILVIQEMIRNRRGSNR